MKPASEPSAFRFGVPVVRIAREVLIKPPPSTTNPDGFEIIISARWPAIST
ncbi:hypothetical protein Y025_5460 [Burkholderia pseudomallei TSV32]|nr:hypothetical protein Y025_5460 [Burkholderia pseudomallei TSV32]